VGRDVDDRAAGAGREEPPYGGGGADDGRGQVGVHQVEDLPRGRGVHRRVAEDGGVVDPAAERRGLLGAVGGLFGDGLVGGAADHAGRAGMGGEPVERTGVELDRDHVRAVAQKAFDDRSAHAAASPGDDDGAGRVGRWHRVSIAECDRRCDFVIWSPLRSPAPRCAVLEITR
jgi:hypothetical protein